jgi:hypothetical protein
MLVYIYERKWFEQWPAGERPARPKVFMPSAVLFNKTANNYKDAK